MIAVQVSSRTKLYFEIVEDTFPNKGGFFSQFNMIFRGNAFYQEKDKEVYHFGKVQKTQIFWTIM